MKTAQLLDAAKAAAGVSSDYALAARLGVTRAVVSSYRQGRTVPDASVAFRLAEVLGTDPARVVAECELERAERKGDDKLSASWRAIIKERWGKRPAPGDGANEHLRIMSTERRSTLRALGLALQRRTLRRALAS